MGSGGGVRRGQEGEGPRLASLSTVLGMNPLPARPSSPPRSGPASPAPGPFPDAGRPVLAGVPSGAWCPSPSAPRSRRCAQRALAMVLGPSAAHVPSPVPYRDQGPRWVSRSNRKRWCPACDQPVFTCKLRQSLLFATGKSFAAGQVTVVQQSAASRAAPRGGRRAGKGRGSGRGAVPRRSAQRAGRAPGRPREAGALGGALTPAPEEEGPRERECPRRPASPSVRKAQNLWSLNFCRRAQYLFYSKSA